MKWSRFLGAVNARWSITKTVALFLVIGFISVEFIGPFGSRRGLLGLIWAVGALPITISFFIFVYYVWGICGFSKNRRYYYKLKKTGEIVVIEEDWRGNIIASLKAKDYDIESVKAALYQYELDTSANDELTLKIHLFRRLR